MDGTHLFFDADGAGGELGITFAFLRREADLSNTDFLVT
jgi:hypothetical protein